MQGTQGAGHKLQQAGLAPDLTRGLARPVAGLLQAQDGVLLEGKLKEYREAFRWGW